MTENGEQLTRFQLRWRMKMASELRSTIERTTGEHVMEHFSIAKTPIGELMLVAHGAALTGVYFAGCNHIPAARSRWTRFALDPILQEAEKQLEEYFAGKRRRFTLTLGLAGTEFQQRIWREIALIPYGETVSYSELAQRAGAPQAVRAAGTSTGRNPVSIIIPCHRVVGKKGGMCGFAGGLERKRYLLQHEMAGPK
jgi:methylated-DNA-[protein]-cysteine S-methyltransferase